ncbi:NACHT C-terminal helical domain 2-containing protein [Coleofasciculus sp. G1-WW12-02]|uniref:NACHT C-terminal helical domain 2-containing protein n=1 Tax=Coleofasciculus sp. G1-WW12-02 TaxID=3068483 RepID=UPI004063C17F
MRNAGDDHRQIDKLVKEHLSDERWREVFLLVSGLMRGGADELLLLMEKEAQTYINTPRLQALLRWADWITADSESNMKPVAKRAIANVNSLANILAYALPNASPNASLNAYAKALAYTYANAYVLTNAYAKAYAESYTYAYAESYILTKANAYIQTITKAIDNAYKLKELKIFKDDNLTVLIARLEALKTKVPNDDQPLEKHRSFADQLLQTCLKGFNLNPKLINLSEAEATAMSNYCYANILMVQCKESAVRVSPKTWAAIEERMLRVPDNG